MAFIDPGQRYYRVTVILGDRDPDLREFCNANPKTCTSVIREALRAWLQAHPKAGDEQPGRRARPKRPRPAATNAPATVDRASPPNHVLPLPHSPAPPATIAEAQQEPAPVGEPPPELQPSPPSEAEPVVPSADREKLQRLFSANRDFR